MERGQRWRLGKWHTLSLAFLLRVSFSAHGQAHINPHPLNSSWYLLYFSRFFMQEFGIIWRFWTASVLTFPIFYCLFYYIEMKFVVQRSPAAMIKKNKSKDLIAINRRNGKRQVWNKVKHAGECSGPAALSLMEGNGWACRWRIHLLKRSKGRSTRCCSHLREYSIGYRLQKSSTFLSSLGTAPGHLAEGPLSMGLWD